MELAAIFLQAQGGSAISQFVMIGLIVVIFYFFMIRPQQKKQKEEKKFREAVKEGTEVVTIGGIHGTIVLAEEKTVTVEIDKNVRIKVERSAISMSSTKEANPDAADDKKK